jgi:hypothetical protein
MSINVVYPGRSPATDRFELEAEELHAMKFVKTGGEGNYLEDNVGISRLRFLGEWSRIQ